MNTIRQLLSQETIEAMYGVAKKGKRNYKKKSSSPKSKSEDIKPEKAK